MTTLMQELARGEEVMARSRRVIKDMKYCFESKPDGAQRMASSLSRHFEVYVDAQIVEDIWEDMPDKSDRITPDKSPTHH